MFFSKQEEPKCIHLQIIMYLAYSSLLSYTW